MITGAERCIILFAEPKHPFVMLSSLLAEALQLLFLPFFIGNPFVKLILLDYFDFFHQVFRGNARQMHIIVNGWYFAVPRPVKVLIVFRNKKLAFLEVVEYFDTAAFCRVINSRGFFYISLSRFFNFEV